MRIIATSDLHGHLPDIPECDLLIVAGDVTPVWNHELDYQSEWLSGRFLSWLKSTPAKEIVWIAGNHDFALQVFSFARSERIHYLIDKAISIDGVSIYGTPWTPNLPDWAFQSDGRAEDIFSTIPEGLDILVSHGPPYGYGDRVGWEHVGCSSLLTAIQQKKPRIMICGHIHSEYGVYSCGETTIYSVAHMNDFYEPVNEPVEIEV